MSRTKGLLSGVAERLLAPFLLAAFLIVPIASRGSDGPPPDLTLRAAVEQGRMDRLQNAPLAQLDAPDETGMTPLMCAALLEDARVVDLLLARGVNINTCNPRLGTALMFAARQGNAPILATLLRHGANPTTLTDFRDDALWCAVLGGDAACISTLLRAHPAPFAVRRRFALLGGVIATGDRADLVRLLVAAGADPNRPGLDGVPPLVSLAEEGDADAHACIRALLDLGADPSAAARDDGRTARDVAAKHRDVETLRLLDQYHLPSHFVQ
jgi:ankyrin repeat protein